MTEPQRLRILFDLVYPGYLRYFDSALRELAARGHEVEVWFDNTEKQAEGLEALEGSGVRVEGRLPRREQESRGGVRTMRLAADWIRYLDPRFADAHYLRRRARRQLPDVMRPLAFLRTLPGPLVQRLVRACQRLEWGTPPSRALDAFVAERRPDVVVVAPGLFFRGAQADLVASARAAGVPSVAAVASWDNLTTKGLLRGSPDRVVVWNEAQAAEARELHFLPGERVAVTGAQPFDKWFERRPSRDAGEFAARVGLPADRPFLLFVGSTASISAPDAERRFVATWLRRLRDDAHETLRDLPVLVRPHPYNSSHWDGADLSALGAAVWPRAGANPVNEDDRSDYFDSIFHARAVVGVNTTAMVEAAIVGRPVFSVALPQFSDTQTGTLHFRHLLPENGGFLRVARSLDEHLAQLGDALDRPETVEAELGRFVASFVRPRGIDRPATPFFADEIEAAARAGVHPAEPAPRWAGAALRLFAAIDALDRRLERRRPSRKAAGRRTADAVGDG